MLALCSPVAPLVMAPSRRVVYQAGAPRNALRHHTLRVRRRQVVTLPLFAQPALQRSDQQAKVFGERGCARRAGT